MAGRCGYEIEVAVRAPLGAEGNVDIDASQCGVPGNWSRRRVTAL
jgi:hypothetical protein